MIEREAAVFVRAAAHVPMRMHPADVVALRGALQTAQEVADTHNRTMVRKENV